MEQEQGELTVEEMSKTMKWKIDDFIVKIQNNQDPFFLRLKFSMLETDGKSKNWFACLRLCKNDEIRFDLVRVDKHTNCFVTISTSILDNKNLNKFKREAIGEFDTSRRSMVKFKPFLDLNHLKENAATLLPEGALTILLEIRIHSSKPQEFQSNQNGCLSTDLNEAFTDMNHTDCVIHCEDEKLNCHSFMLGARSPVFRAMLSSSFQEGLTKTIRIENFTPATIKDMLYFIYSDSCEELESTPRDLFKAADHFQIDLLKEVTTNMLIRDLDNSSALEYLVLADTYNSPNLKKAALEFTVGNIEALMETPEYEDKAHEYPALFLEVTRSLVDLMNKK